MKPGQFFVMVAAAALGLVLSACGGNPAAPTGAGVTLRGVAVNQGAGTAGLTALSSRSAAAGPSTITVTVLENTSITTTISGNGTFELQGLPTGTFTLVFSSNGVTLGTITITSVPDQAEIEIVVQLSTTNVTLVKVTINGSDETDNDTNGTSPGTAKTCLIEGGKVGAGVELEGSISEVTTKDKAFTMLVNGQRASDLVSVDASKAGFSCAGVKGTCDSTLIVANARVHVSGKLDSCSLTEAKVTASAVKFQH
jgi:hypothetical protein